MKLIAFARQHFGSLFKLYLFILFLFILQIVLSYVFVYTISLTQIQSDLQLLASRIGKDLKYDGINWDTSLYNADPLTPYPNGSSGFSNPLYIITKDGFIIERSSPIRGYLDTSDYNHLIQFQKPQTINTVTKERWRVLSKPIIKDGTSLGIVVVSYYNPPDIETSVMDRNMQDNINIIMSQLQIVDSKISTTKLDIRNIHYEFSFEVVDIYNNVLINNGRVPTFIDKSYYAQELEKKQKRIISDNKTQEQFMIVTRIIRGKKQEPIGLIVAGESVKSLFITLQNYIFFSLLVSCICIVPLLIYVVHIFRRDVVKLLSEKTTLKSHRTITTIVFDKKNSSISIDEQKYEIPYASNQYYICDAIFSSPTKNWEYDELLEKLGDFNSSEVNSRKVYDSVLAINKKCGIKIISYKNKIFTMNPYLLPYLVKK